MRNCAGARMLSCTSEDFGFTEEIEAFPRDTTPIFLEMDYLLRSAESDYWRLAEFYAPQTTNCACSAASAAIALNGLLSTTGADGVVLSERTVLEAAADPLWPERVAQDGDGVTFAELRTFLERTLDRIDLPHAGIEVFAPDPDDRGALARLRHVLRENEGAPDSVVLAYYHQGTLTGDWDGLHVSPIGAYNAEADRVLIMDVDRDLHLPYWASTASLLDALVTPAPPAEGHLAGLTGGIIRIGT
ncbi:phytochelatin synthase family protein [Propylenella binzhouense]|uniref:glutathione gamma-glutamylcysteinyltransferase n=1 Tax=Propylenella binzhouense TaxID=2555902 RepID=A0A964WVE2_9HYPH|nr:phytochelatin synthase family protein [Propylenella binzhouense]MYZ50091.1 hypothetical protein [Propylenella binzhouense]